MCRTKVGVFTLIKLLGLVQMSSTTYYLKRVTNLARVFSIMVYIVKTKNEIEKREDYDYVYSKVSLLNRVSYGLI